MKRRLWVVVWFLTFVACIHAETYVVVVGISNYAYINSLKLPEKDAQSIASLYKSRKAHVTLITGRSATKSGILKALQTQFSKATSSDEVIFSYSGHGYTGGLCPYEMKQTSDGLTYKEVWDEFKKSQAGKKIIFADACMAGGFRIQSHGDSVTKHSHVPVLTFLSSRSHESSRENALMANGVFTTYLLRALRGKADVNRDRKITAKELFDYVSKGVKEKTQDKQHPVMWGKFSDDMVVIDW
jgi:uncharacterized caspase-like protein